MWTNTYNFSLDSSLDDGDKIIMPSSTLEELLASSNNRMEDLPSPLTFELRNTQTQAIIHCGVREFSGKIDTIELPSWMIDALALSEGDRVTAKLKSLPKGTWARLRPLSPDASDIVDYRAALEAHLRAHYTAFTTGQVLNCKYGAKNYPFLVVDLKPEQAINISNVDLEVDLEPVSDLTENGQRPGDGIRMDMSTQKRSIRLGEAVEHVRIEKDQYQYWTIDSNGASSICIDIVVEQGDADVVAASNERKPTLDHHDWSSVISDEKRRLVLDAIATKSVNIGVHGYLDSVVSWTAVTYQASNEDDTSSAQEDSHAGQEGYGECPNCKAWVPERTMPLHQGFCFRNNILCPSGCGQILKLNSPEQRNHWHCPECDYVGSITGKDKHMVYFHQQKACACGEFTSTSYTDLARHRRSECPNRLIICRFCHTLVPQGAASSSSHDRLLGIGHMHESTCGSRTIQCQQCHRQVPIKDIQVHAKIHEVERQNQKLPPLCNNVNCIRPQTNNRLGLCQHCFGPLWIPHDDPTNVKLLQLLARKIHTRLMTPCNNPSCRNKYCAATMGPQDANTAASILLPMINSIQQQLKARVPKPELHLCVDEATTRKKFLAETLKEGTMDRYALDWCVKALDVEHEDLDRAREWLNRNAPKLS